METFRTEARIAFCMQRGGKAAAAISMQFAIASATGTGGRKCIPLVMTGSTRALLERGSLLLQGCVLRLESGCCSIGGAVRNNSYCCCSYTFPCLPGLEKRVTRFLLISMVSLIVTKVAGFLFTRKRIARSKFHDFQESSRQRWSRP